MGKSSAFCATWMDIMLFFANIYFYKGHREQWSQLLVNILYHTSRYITLQKQYYLHASQRQKRVVYQCCCRIKYSSAHRDWIMHRSLLSNYRWHLQYFNLVLCEQLHRTWYLKTPGSMRFTVEIKSWTKQLTIVCSSTGFFSMTIVHSILFLFSMSRSVEKKILLCIFIFTTQYLLIV